MPDLPPPLPPSERTVGQLIAETIRTYGQNFWLAVPLGIPIALADQFSVHKTIGAQMVIFWIATPFFVGAYLWACRLVLGGEPTRAAVAAAFIVWLPFPLLRALFILPAVAWLALIGLAVPAAIVERLSFRAALARGRELGMADFAHSLGSLAALVIVVGVSEITLSELLRSQGDAGQRTGVVLADLILTPMLYLGGALLYADQAARVGSRRPTSRRRRNADLHPPDDPDATGRPDAQVKP